VWTQEDYANLERSWDEEDKDSIRRFPPARIPVKRRSPAREAEARLNAFYAEQDERRFIRFVEREAERKAQQDAEQARRQNTPAGLSVKTFKEMLDGFPDDAMLVLDDRDEDDGLTTIKGVYQAPGIPEGGAVRPEYNRGSGKGAHTLAITTGER
jgi:hypothetical protein